ncbi:hypothetical protein PENTCL1PPCAC_28079, partial [Pristionchus entomophagus]
SHFRQLLELLHQPLAFSENSLLHFLPVQTKISERMQSESTLFSPLVSDRVDYAPATSSIQFNHRTEACSIGEVLAVSNERLLKAYNLIFFSSKFQIIA